MVFIKKTVDNKRVALQISINLKLEFKKASIYETTFKTFCPNLWKNIVVSTIAETSTSSSFRKKVLEAVFGVVIKFVPK